MTLIIWPRQRSERTPDENRNRIVWHRSRRKALDKRIPGTAWSPARVDRNTPTSPLEDMMSSKQTPTDNRAAAVTGYRHVFAADQLWWDGDARLYSLSVWRGTGRLCDRHSRIGSVRMYPLQFQVPSVLHLRVTLCWRSNHLKHFDVNPVPMSGEFSADGASFDSSSVQFKRTITAFHESSFLPSLLIIQTYMIPIKILDLPYEHHISLHHGMLVYLHNNITSEQLNKLVFKLNKPSIKMT